MKPTLLPIGTRVTLSEATAKQYPSNHDLIGRVGTVVAVYTSQSFAAIGKENQHRLVAWDGLIQERGFHVAALVSTGDSLGRGLTKREALMARRRYVKKRKEIGVREALRETAREMKLNFDRVCDALGFDPKAINNNNLEVK